MTKWIITLSLMLIIGCGTKEKDTANEQTPQTSAKTEAPKEVANGDNLTIYYFHTNHRCWSCTQFEKLTQEILTSHFAGELADSTIVFRPVNIQKEKNKHYVDDYKLVSKSLVLSLRKDDRELDWENLDQIWQLVRDSKKFTAYVKSAIENYKKRIG